MKICSKCKQEKPLSEFYANKSSADGKQSYCKACSKAKAKAWESANIDKVRARQSAWRAANPDKVEAVKERHRAKRAAAKVAWLEANKDAITNHIKTPEE